MIRAFGLAVWCTTLRSGSTSTVSSRRLVITRLPLRRNTNRPVCLPKLPGPSSFQRGAFSKRVTFLGPREPTSAYVLLILAVSTNPDQF